jgi:hypothetical protein
LASKNVGDECWMTLEEAIVEASSLGGRGFGVGWRGTVAACNVADHRRGAR